MITLSNLTEDRLSLQQVATTTSFQSVGRGSRLYFAVSVSMYILNTNKNTHYIWQTGTLESNKHAVQINHQPDATIFQFIILTFIYSSTCFGRFPAHHQKLNDCSGSLWFYLRIVVTVVLCSWSGRSVNC